MEILITIPPWLVEYWESMIDYGLIVNQFVVRQSLTVWDFLRDQRNAFFVVLSMVLFWPFYAYCIVAVTTASTWIFWLFASVLMGIVQMGYVSYQFVMIAIDIFVLTLLKTYQVIMRSRVAQFVFFFSEKIHKSRQKLSLRREWRKRCEAAKEYSDFLAIPILENSNYITTTTTTTTTNNDIRPRQSGKSVSTMGNQGMPKKRSFSFGNMEMFKEKLQQIDEDIDETQGSVPTKGLRRRWSLSQLKVLQDEKEQLTLDEDIHHDLGPSTAQLLLSTTARLREERENLKNGKESSLEFLLSGVVKRNHLTLEDAMVNNARSVAVSGQYEFSPTTRKAIEAYYDNVEKGLEVLTEDAPLTYDKTAATMIADLQDRMRFIRKMKQNMGRTALMLSGGGAQAMYHLGTIRALIQSKLYDDIKVISGTSGGSIAAACCAMYTTKEIEQDICVPTVSTDFRLTGEMKRRNIRWFPPMADMMSYWFKHRLLVDSEYFFSTCEFYWGTTTFAEAFERTGKHVCITVSASRASSGSAQRLLLNHISTPHVTLASAVAASCALPGVMKPANLQTKNSLGKIEDFEVDGVQWIDGSVQADLPFQRISTLFNVSNYVVCQTNFHVLPFLNKEHHPNSKSTYWKLFQTIEWDIRNRALKLSRLGLFPRLFGQDISKVFKQKYHGNLTLVPRFTAMQTFGLKALVNPDVKEMENYLKFGQIAAWPYLRVLRDMLRLERALDDGLERLKRRAQELRPDADISESVDDLDSIASSSFNATSRVQSNVRGVRFGSATREVAVLEKRLSKMEQENLQLRREVDELRSLLGRFDRTISEEKKAEEKVIAVSRIHSEGDVFNLVAQIAKKS